jgi:GrpB-like predicted nucleotidyltransferase (UPF0157 family)
MAIEVVDYDDAWPCNAETACAELRDSLPGLFTAIEHIGSTAVPGLAAKPVIDLMAAAADLDQITAHDGSLRQPQARPGHPARVTSRTTPAPRPS